MGKWAMDEGPSREERLRGRLASFSRYSRLIQDQVVAVQEEDLTRYHDLSRIREQIQGELDEASPGSFPAADPEGEEERALQTEIVRVVREAMAGDQALRKLLSRKRSDAADGIRALSRREEQVKQYVKEGDAGSREVHSRLNVRL